MKAPIFEGPIFHPRLAEGRRPRDVGHFRPSSFILHPSSFMGPVIRRLTGGKITGKNTVQSSVTSLLFGRTRGAGARMLHYHCDRAAGEGPGPGLHLRGWGVRSGDAL